MEEKKKFRRRIEAQQDLVIDAQFAILDLMRESGITKAELAERLGLTKSSVSQFFAASANPTLRQVARYCDALDAKAVLKTLSLREELDAARPDNRAIRLADETIHLFMKCAEGAEPTDTYAANENYGEYRSREAA